jgi:predicted RNA-binding protein with PIN domain
MIDAEFSRAGGRVILVDGFNVLHAVLLGKEREEGWWRRESREKLLRRVSVWQSGPDEIWVAFDGTQPAWSVWAEPIAIPRTSHSKSTIVHSVFVESADDWIVRRARRATHPDRTIVVSGDRKVTGRARSAGCEIWTPWALISHCPIPDENPSDRSFT